MSRESVSLGNQSLNLRCLGGRRLFRILNLRDALIIFVSYSSKSLAKAIYCIRSLFKSVSLYFVFLSQI
ncbi:hypothetical protein AWB89_25490 [Mycobacterium paraense]|nr:hypothetical protein AWB89_25490 [Mycobacterium paraense]